MKSISLCLSIAVGSSLITANATARGFTVDFSQCTEFAGVGPVDFAKASALVPSAFNTMQVGTTGAIVVRATSCAAVKVNGGREFPTTGLQRRRCARVV